RGLRRDGAAIRVSAGVAVPARRERHDLRVLRPAAGVAGKTGGVGMIDPETRKAAERFRRRCREAFDEGIRKMPEEDAAKMVAAVGSAHLQPPAWMRAPPLQAAFVSLAPMLDEPGAAGRGRAVMRSAAAGAAGHDGLAFEVAVRFAAAVPTDPRARLHHLEGA